MPIWLVVVVPSIHTAQARTTGEAQMKGTEVHAAYQRVCSALVDAVADAELGSPLHRVGSALASLLATHALDRRGRCQVCRHRDLFGRRLRCRVLIVARYWLTQPTSGLLQVSPQPWSDSDPDTDGDRHATTAPGHRPRPHRAAPDESQSLPMARAC